MLHRHVRGTCHVVSCYKLWLFLRSVLRVVLHCRHYLLFYVEPRSSPATFQKEHPVLLILSLQAKSLVISYFLFCCCMLSAAQSILLTRALLVVLFGAESSKQQNTFTSAKVQTYDVHMEELTSHLRATISKTITDSIIKVCNATWESRECEVDQEWDQTLLNRATVQITKYASISNVYKIICLSNGEIKVLSSSTATAVVEIKLIIQSTSTIDTHAGSIF